jgi:hypothetical protein
MHNPSNYFRPPFVTVRGIYAPLIVTRSVEIPDEVTERQEIESLLKEHPYVRLIPVTVG